MGRGGAMNRIVIEIIDFLAKEMANPPKILKKDLVAVIEAKKNGDFNKVKETKLYNKYPCAYCRTISFLNFKEVR
jgi:hypothetical protein